MTEEWKDIVGYEGIYQVSNKGRVRTFRHKDGFVGFKITDEPKIMSLISHGNGYLYVSLMNNDVRKNHYVHRLVAEAFIGNIPKGHVINHLDYDKSNNSSDNLEIVSQKENVHYSLANMKKPKKRVGDYYIVDRGGRYEVTVKLKYIGTYKTIEEARKVRDEYINQIHYD
jgi:hypothetical protein